MCDLIRQPYTTKFRPFSDSNVEVDIYWYPARPDAPWLPYPTAISSRMWDMQERGLGLWTDLPVGEVADRPRRYNKAKVKPAALGTHQCGTPEMFRDGATFDGNRRVARRADGLPVCCGQWVSGILWGGRVAPPFVGQGGVYWGTHSSSRSYHIDYPDREFVSPAEGVNYWRLAGAGTSGGWLGIDDLAEGNTYRFRVWTADSTADFSFAGGISPGFLPHAWGVNLPPGDFYREATVTIPSGSPANWHFGIYFGTGSSPWPITFIDVEQV